MPMTNLTVAHDFDTARFGAPTRASVVCSQIG
jgi:hypothetical protein